MAATGGSSRAGRMMVYLGQSDALLDAAAVLANSVFFPGGFRTFTVHNSWSL